MTINIITSGTGQMAAEDRISYEKELLTNRYADTYYEGCCKKKSLPKNEGTTLNFRRPLKYTVDQNPSPLNEGITPASTAFNFTPVTVVPQQFGKYSAFTDRIILQGIDDNVEAAAQELGKWSGLTSDVVIRNVAVACTSVQFQGGVSAITSLDNTGKLTVAGIKKARRTLKRNNVKPLKGGFYALLASSDAVGDLKLDPDYVEMVKFADPSKLTNGELPTIDGVMIYETNNNYINFGGGASINSSGIQTTGGAADVHYSVMIGEEALGGIDLGNQEAEIFIKTASESGTADPIEQRNTVGTKFWQGAVILDQLRMIVIKSTVSV
jgi:N4-gp56 family major capsid protein